MVSTSFSGLFVKSLTGRIRAALASGKVAEEELDRVLTSNAQSMLDVAPATREWIPLEDVESLVTVVAGLCGDEPGLAQWGCQVVDGWQGEARVIDRLDDAMSLIDGPGYAVTQISELLMEAPGWIYEGGREGFSVRFEGLGEASTPLKVLIGAMLCRVGECPDAAFGDVRFEGVDVDDLFVFGERAADSENAAARESLLLRAALVG